MARNDSYDVAQPKARRQSKPTPGRVLARVWITGVLAAVLVSVSGCISAKSFPDPAVKPINSDDIKKSDAPLKLNLQVEFQRNGQLYPRADPILKAQSEKVLLSSGAILPVAGNGDGEIKIIVNNVGDTSEAAKRGFITGFTFGLAGNTVYDGYEMQVVISIGDKIISRKDIKHGIYTAVGNSTLPPGVTPVSPSAAFAMVFEQMLLKVILDMQQTGELAAYMRHSINSSILLAIR